MDQLVFAKLDRFGPSQVEVFNRLMTASRRDPCQTHHSLIDKETLWKFHRLLWDSWPVCLRLHAPYSRMHQRVRWALQEDG